VTAETLAASAGLAFVAAAVYVVIGMRLGRRKVGAEFQLAATMFAVWWFGLAASTALSGIQSALAAVGAATLPLVLTLTHLGLAAVCAALWGLLFYLVFIFTGKRGALLPLAGLYVVAYALLVYQIVANAPVGVELRRWGVALDYAVPQGGPVFAAAVVLLILPPIVGALAYFALFFRVRDATVRYRTAVVSWSIIVWFGTALLVTLSDVRNNDLWQLGSRLLGLVAAVAIYAAYEPPAFVRRRLGVASVRDAPASEA
jgi:hypothetical protein